MQLGKVHIVTNAQRAWVFHSSENFLPSTFIHLNTHSDIEVLSARDLYESTFEDPIDWKYEAYLHNIDNIMNANHLILIGDQFNDIDAGLSLWEDHLNIANCTLDTLRLLDRPTPSELLK